MILACPGLQDVAHEVASDLLKQHDITRLDPDHIYFHRFDAAQSSTQSFTGWEHLRATPSESTTLTQLVIQRFRATDQDNADLLDLYGGFYTAGPEAGTFNETNEVRLHGNDVLKYFWAIDFSTLYTDRLTAFWNDCGTDFRTLAKCNFLIKAVQARDKRQLSDEDFQFVTKEVFGPTIWPVSLQLLQSEHPDTDCIRTLDVAGYVASNILRFVAPKGRQIVYLPGETDAFQVLETATDMHYWMLQRLNKEEERQAFMTHFSLADRQRIAESITDLMNRLVSTWGKYDHRLINQENQVIRGDAFSWLRDSTRAAMFAEAALSLTSNGDLRKKLWVGYLSAGMKVFGPMAVVGWPVALPLIGASIANMGLNVGQAINGKTAEERKAGTVGAVLSGIDVLFNLLALKGPGSLEEIGPDIDAAEATEMADLKGTTLPPRGIEPTPTDASLEIRASALGEPDVLSQRRDARKRTRKIPGYLSPRLQPFDGHHAGRHAVLRRLQNRRQWRWPLGHHRSGKPDSVFRIGTGAPECRGELGNGVERRTQGRRKGIQQAWGRSAWRLQLFAPTAGTLQPLRSTERIEICAQRGGRRIPR
ncbi:dermonecrotic toxin domain-containing protein [Pseudomonas frederiksbergensis]|uniref:dermonecrotic toxin domain-containing protein n=1 Tax=Pseudomonas frederiksbergensis TaxID=104087 RepID=UPI003D20EC69